MEFWLTLLIATITICYLLLIIKIYIEVKYKRSSENDYLSITVYAIKKLIAYKMEVPIVKISENKDIFWLESAIRAVQHHEETPSQEEEKIMKKTTKLFTNHPRSMKNAVKEIHNYARLYCKIVERIFKLLVCEKMYWKTKLGSEDAAMTGVITGLLWVYKSFLMNRLKRRIFLIDKPDIAVSPLWGSSRLEVDFQCIFSIRLGNVIKAIRSIYNSK